MCLRACCITSIRVGRAADEWQAQLGNHKFPELGSCTCHLAPSSFCATGGCLCRSDFRDSLSLGPLALGLGMGTII